MSSLRKARTVYAPDSGVMLLTAAESARYLNYHPVSIRRLVGRGDLRPHSRVGRALLFMREDLDRFRYGSAWAAKKSGVRRSAAARPARQQMRAVVVVRAHGRETIFSQSAAFHWDDVPAIRVRVHARHGDVPFFIVIAAPDGSGFKLSFHQDLSGMPHSQSLRPAGIPPHKTNK